MMMFETSGSDLGAKTNTVVNGMRYVRGHDELIAPCVVPDISADEEPWLPISWRTS